jgi:hypothetical protein
MLVCLQKPDAGTLRFEGSCSKCAQGNRLLRIWLMEITMHRLMLPLQGWTSTLEGQLAAAGHHFEAFCARTECEDGAVAYMEYFRVCDRFNVPEVSSAGET